jgi:diguanylate cyclase (GGDEF)-like protein/PAS domain S-box-containing protein
MSLRTNTAALAVLGLGLAFALSRGRRRGRRPGALVEPHEQVALRRAAAVFEGTDQGIIVTDAEQRIVAINQAFTRLTGYSAAEVLGRTPALLHSGLQDVAFYRRMWAALDEAGQWQGEIWDRRKNGQVFPAWENISAIRGADGRALQYVAILSDITPLKRAQERLQHLAQHDALTGLPNRLFFAASLQQALERAKRHRHKVALLYIDLDRFKRVNDLLGHAIGDQLLKEVAERLRQAVRAQDVVARLGGDEFTVTFEELARPEEAERLAEKIESAIARPMVLSGREVRGGASIGIALYPDDGDSAEALTQAADAAMYRAKGLGRHGHAFYSGEDLGARRRAGPRRLLMDVLGELRARWHPMRGAAHEASSDRGCGERLHGPDSG